MGNTAYGTTTENVVTLTKASGVVTMDLSRGNRFKWTGSDVTGSVTAAVDNIPAASSSAGGYIEWTLLLGAHSTAPTMTWTPVDVWVQEGGGGSAPTIGNSDVHHITFWTYDGGTTIYARDLE